MRAYRRTRIPDFDRLVVRSGHDLGPVRGKRHRHDLAAVRVHLLAKQLQFIWQASQQSSVLAKEGRFEGSRRTRIPAFDRLVARSGHNPRPVRGKRHRRDEVAVCVRLLAQQPQRVCKTSQLASVLAEEGRFEALSAPESQTLIVWSHDPDTILVPSGENATEKILPLWAFVFSLNCTIVPARQKPASVSFDQGEVICEKRTRIPDFDRTVRRSRGNLGAVRGKCDRGDLIAVGAGLLRYTFDERRVHPANKREEERLIGCMRAFGSMEIWDHKAAASLKGA